MKVRRLALDAWLQDYRQGHGIIMVATQHREGWDGDEELAIHHFSLSQSKLEKSDEGNTWIRK